MEGIPYTPLYLPRSPHDSPAGAVATDLLLLDRLVADHIKAHGQRNHEANHDLLPEA